MQLTSLSITLKSSRSLAALLIIAHSVAGTVLLLLPVAIWPLLAMILLLAVSAWYVVQRHALLRLPSSVIGLKLMDEGKLDMLTASGNWHEAQLGTEQFVNPRLTIVSYRCEGTRWTRHVVIVADMLDAEAFRELRVRLKWRR